MAEFLDGEVGDGRVVVGDGEGGGVGDGFVVWVEMDDGDGAEGVAFGEVDAATLEDATLRVPVVDGMFEGALEAGAFDDGDMPMVFGGNGADAGEFNGARTGIQVGDEKDGFHGNSIGRGGGKVTSKISVLGIFLFRFTSHLRYYPLV